MSSIPRRTVFLTRSSIVSSISLVLLMVAIGSGR